MSDEKDIENVRQDELRAARGKPPLHDTTAEQRARVKFAMLRAIRECNEADFELAILDLGHTPGSGEYNRMMGLWRARFGPSRK
jgi:hypothetical protein